MPLFAAQSWTSPPPWYASLSSKQGPAGRPGALTNGTNRVKVPSVDVTVKRPLEPVETKGYEDDERPLHPACSRHQPRANRGRHCVPSTAVPASPIKTIWGSGSRNHWHTRAPECLSAAALAPPTPLPVLNFLRSNATPILILCFTCMPGACFPLPPCGRHCPSWGISSISIFTRLHPPSTPAAIFHLQVQMTYIPSLGPWTRVAWRSALSPAALQLAPGRHCGCGSQAELGWAWQARRPAQSHQSQLSRAQ